MAIRGVNLSQTLKFVSANDPEKGTPGETSFIFKKLDGFQGAYLGDSMVGFEQDRKTGQQSTKIHMGRVSFETIQLALQEAQNFLDPETNLPIEIRHVQKNIMGRTYLVVDDEIMRKIPPEIIQEAYQYLSDQSAVGLNEAKKSGPQS